MSLMSNTFMVGDSWGKASSFRALCSFLCDWRQPPGKLLSGGPLRVSVCPRVWCQGMPFSPKLRWDSTLWDPPGAGLHWKARWTCDPNGGRRLFQTLLSQSKHWADFVGKQCVEGGALGSDIFLVCLRVDSGPGFAELLALCRSLKLGRVLEQEIWLQTEESLSVTV